MINKSNFPQSLMSRLSLNSEKECYSLEFDNDYDFGNFLQDAYYESGSILFDVELNDKNDSFIHYVLGEVVTDKFIKEYNLDIDNLFNIDCRIDIKSNILIRQLFDFYWSSFVKDLLVNNQRINDKELEFDITDYINSDSFNIMNKQLIVTLSFKFDNREYQFEFNQDNIFEYLDLSDFDISVDTFNQPDWLMTHPDLLTEINKIEKFKLRKIIY